MEDKIITLSENQEGITRAVIQFAGKHVSLQQLYRKLPPQEVLLSFKDLEQIIKELNE